MGDWASTSHYTQGGRVMNVKDKLRNLTVGQAPKFRHEIINIEGEDFEIRQPSMKVKSELLRKSKMHFGGKESEQTEKLDFLALQVWSVIYCTYVPGTDEVVFTGADFEALSAQPAGSFVDKIATITTQLMHEVPTDDAKNSEHPQEKKD